MGLFNDRRKTTDGKNTVPVWFMRQAGRYHKHYQGIRKDRDFMTMCKDPALACEITMGPINDFGFDAAILFSDLLFPLEQLGMGLSYHSGPPTLEMKLETADDLKKLKLVGPGKDFYAFQGKATELLRKELPAEKTLLGFVGAPFTLYTYAVEGAHKGNLVSSKLGLRDGRWQGFTEMLLPELLEEMRCQIKGGADAMCLFDTAVGELTFCDFKEYVLPVLKTVTREFKKEFPDKKVIYYSKLTHMNYLQEIQDDNIDVLGIDWRHDVGTALKTLGGDYMIQGNLDPAHLFLPWNQLEHKIEGLWKRAYGSGVNPDRWIMGLGHGVLPETPQENVRAAVKWIQERALY